jgi:NitT/TauT family transport system permease protein
VEQVAGSTRALKPTDGAARLRPWLRAAAVRVALFVAVLAAFWGLWEGYRWLGIKASITWPFTVDDTTMPHLHEIVGQLFEPSRVNGPLLISVLFHSALFTAKEAAVGFALGATVGFGLAIVLAHSRLLQRGFLPYIVASQTVPILAIAPMVVVWLGSLHVAAWFSVAVIAAYLTFFPVTINALRGLTAVDPGSLELMRSYAASRRAILWRLRVPTSLPYVFSALRVAAAACVVGAIVGELPSSIQDGLGGAILNFAQYYSFEPKNLWATNLIAAALGICFFLVVVVAERIVVRRAPEQLV